MTIQLTTKKKTTFVVKIKDESLNCIKSVEKALDLLQSNGIEPVTWETKNEVKLTNKAVYLEI